MGVLEKAGNTIRREHMLPPDCAVIAGVSGGADSVTLLHVLCILRDAGEIAAVEAVHVNHGLRGKESLRDCRFTETLCRQWNVPLSIKTVDVARLAADQGKGVEEMGREVRYAAFEEAARRYPVSRIATAHNADDNAETVLLHICRGSGLHGAAGIPPVRGNIIRPLIACTRLEIEDYCTQNALCFVTDSTNADTAYARNRIRHEVLPQLRALNPQVISAISRFTEQVRVSDAYLEERVTAALQAAQLSEDCFDRAALLLLTEPLISRALCRITQTAQEKHIGLLRDAIIAGNGTVTLPTGTRWTVTAETFQKVVPAAEMPPFCYTVMLDKPYRIGEELYHFEVLSRREYEQKLNICKIRFANALDYDTICGSLYVRSRRSGDAYHPAGRQCGKTLKQLFNEKKIDARNTVPVVCDINGIVLVFGFGCDERVRITPQTTHVLVLLKGEDVV